MPILTSILSSRLVLCCVISIDNTIHIPKLYNSGTVPAGLEPTLTGSKPVALPLGYGTTILIVNNGVSLTVLKNITKSKFGYCYCQTRTDILYVCYVLD